MDYGRTVTVIDNWLVMNYVRIRSYLM